MTHGLLILMCLANISLINLEWTKRFCYHENQCPSAHLGTKVNSQMRGLLMTLVKGILLLASPNIGIPIESTYGISTYIYHEHQPNDRQIHHTWMVWAIVQRTGFFAWSSPFLSYDQLVVRWWLGPQSCFRCYCLPWGYCLACSFSWTRSASCCVLLAGLLCLPCWLFPYFLGLSVSGPSSGLSSWFCPPPVPRSFWVGLWWGRGPGCYRSVLAVLCPGSLVGLPFLWASSWPLFLSLSWSCLRVPSNVRF